MIRAIYFLHKWNIKHLLEIDSEMINMYLKISVLYTVVLEYFVMVKAGQFETISEIDPQRTPKSYPH